jgi:DNA invertase Pin-like site-specific DNA recombinase
MGSNRSKSTLHIYTRVSTVVQETDGTSLDTQRELGIKKSKELGFKHKVWNEGAKSSHHEDIALRPKLSQLLTAIREGDVQHLWVIEQSRLSRNDMVAATIRNECNKAGVTFYTKDGQYDLNNPSDIFTRQILDATSQLENALRAERSRMGKLQKVRQGFWHGGPPPFGYEIKDGKLSAHPDESVWIKKIYDRYHKGTSVAGIKSELDRNGIETRRKKGTWSIGSIQAILKNEHYVGRYVYRDSKSEESVEVSCPKLVDETVWNDCQSKRKRILNRKGQINRTVYFYLLRDLMVCGDCGRPMGGRTNKKVFQHYYYCPERERTWVKDQPKDDKKWVRGRGCSMRKSLNIPATDSAVWERVKSTVSKSSILKERVKTELLRNKDQDESEYKSDIRNQRKVEKRIKTGIQRIEESIAKIETDRLLERMDEKLYRTVKKNLRNELDSAKGDLEQSRLHIQETVDQKRWIDWVGKFHEMYDDVDHLSPEDRKDYLEGVVDRLTVNLDPDTHEHVIDISFKYPIVGDSLDYRDVSKKSMGYDLIEGNITQSLRGSFVSKHDGSKKNSEDRSLDRDRPILWNKVRHRGVILNGG